MPLQMRFFPGPPPGNTHGAPQGKRQTRPWRCQLRPRALCPMGVNREDSKREGNSGWGLGDEREACKRFSVGCCKRNSVRGEANLPRASTTALSVGEPGGRRPSRPSTVFLIRLLDVDHSTAPASPAEEDEDAVGQPARKKEGRTATPQNALRVKDVPRSPRSNAEAASLHLQNKGGVAARTRSVNPAPASALAGGYLTLRTRPHWHLPHGAALDPDAVGFSFVLQSTHHIASGEGRGRHAHKKHEVDLPLPTLSAPTAAEPREAACTIMSTPVAISSPVRPRSRVRSERRNEASSACGEGSTPRRPPKASTKQVGARTSALLCEKTERRATKAAPPKKKRTNKKTDSPSRSHAHDPKKIQSELADASRHFSGIIEEREAHRNEHRPVGLTRRLGDLRDSREKTELEEGGSRPSEPESPIPNPEKSRGRWFNFPRVWSGSNMLNMPPKKSST
ncbi:hypothetical protein K438DRAFT_1768543 [Mycena galopus ATCC 62051]|nr:hypothetical protein K438DRAFT_1768543 [Mycena galopus ATCC 62051]